MPILVQSSYAQRGIASLSAGTGQAAMPILIQSLIQSLVQSSEAVPAHVKLVCRHGVGCDAHSGTKL